MGTVFHLLCFTPLVQRESALETVRAVHAEGDQIDGILVLGSSAGEPSHARSSEADDFLEMVMLECLETDADSLPPVITVPGQHDIRPLQSSNGMITKALTRYWGDTEQGLWRGDEQDTVESIRNIIFADFVACSEDHANFPNWRQGVLPGEGSVVLGEGTGTLGIVAVNTVFRMAVPDSAAELATCALGQLDSVVGGEYLQWANANDLTLMVAGHSANIPPSLAPVLPKTVLLASGGESARSGPAARWLVTPRGAARQHRLLRVEITDAGVPKVRDLAAPPAEQPVSLPKPRRVGNRVGMVSQSTPETYDEQAVVDKFYQQISTGRMILVAVSGVHSENSLIDTDEFTQRLVQAVYGEVLDPVPTTSEIWNTALTELGSRIVGQHVEELRGADQDSMTAARRILQAPWWRIYDFTATDVFSSLLEIDQQITETNTFVNAVVRKPGTGNSTVEVVAMYGNPTGSEALDFTIPADDDLSPRAVWFRKLKAELLTHPAVFMAASPSSRSLWNALALTNWQGEMEPVPRFLITGPGTAADRVRIRQTGLTHIQISPHEFAVKQLRPGLEILKQGMKRLSDIRTSTRQVSGIKLVSLLVENPPTGSVEFLKGQDPTWGDIKDGFAVKLSIIDRIRESTRPAEDGKHGIVLVEGRAGSGKTTALMQYAYELHQAGRTVAWIDREVTDPLRNLRAQAINMSANVIFVDDVDMFGRLGASLLKELNNGGKALVVASIRTSRSDELDVSFRSRRVSADEPLKDEDLGLIVDVLHTHGLPGILKRQKLRPEKIDKLRELCDRSLLAAMIQVVTGKRFEDKVASEYHELDTEQVVVYATVCVFESAIVFKKRGIEQEDLLQIVSGRGAPKPSLNLAINRLVERRFLTIAPDGTVRCRQRTIADTVVETILKKTPKQLGFVIEYLLRFYAQYAADIRDKDDPYYRILIRLLNHSLMVSLRLKPTQVRDIYSTVHALLQDNFHYWLQRGEYELERGDLGIAENHLETAQGCEGGATDPFVLTAWSAIRLRRSTESPVDGSLRDHAFEAIGVLENVTRLHGGASPHAFSVIAQRGTEWVEACEGSLAVGQVDDTLRRILAIVEAGRRYCKDNHEFMRRADEFEPKLNHLLQRSKGIPL